MAKINKDLQALEILEIETLDLLNSKNVLDKLYFGGGTMLRLCHNLNRYSTDLDFWLKDGANQKNIFNLLLNIFQQKYSLIDSQNKFHILLFQIKSPSSKRSLKIEIRKVQTDFQWERKIAFSRFTIKQVQLNGLTLEQMMKNKISAFLSRKIIRDCFDIDFLFKRGIEIKTDERTLTDLLNIINSFKERDFKVTLSSLLEADEREYYIENKFSLLKEHITSLLKVKK